MEAWDLNEHLFVSRGSAGSAAFGGVVSVGRVGASMARLVVGLGVD